MAGWWGGRGGGRRHGRRRQPVVSDAGPRLPVEVRMWMLVMHRAEVFRERGTALSVSYNPMRLKAGGLDGAGCAVLGGQATGGAEALWGGESMAGMVPGSFVLGNRLDGEVGRVAGAYRSPPGTVVVTVVVAPPSGRGPRHNSDKLPISRCSFRQRGAPLWGQRTP